MLIVTQHNSACKITALRGGLRLLTFITKVTIYEGAASQPCSNTSTTDVLARRYLPEFSTEADIYGNPPLMMDTQVSMLDIHCHHRYENMEHCRQLVTARRIRAITAHVSQSRTTAPRHIPSVCVGCYLSISPHYYAYTGSMFFAPSDRLLRLAGTINHLN